MKKSQILKKFDKSKIYGFLIIPFLIVYILLFSAVIYQGTRNKEAFIIKKGRTFVFVMLSSFVILLINFIISIKKGMYVIDEDPKYLGIDFKDE